MSQLVCELQGRGKYHHKMLMQVLKVKRCMILNSRHQVSFISQVPTKLKNLFPTLTTIVLKASFLLLLSYHANVLSFGLLALSISFDCIMNILSLDSFFEKDDDLAHCDDDNWLANGADLIAHCHDDNQRNNEAGGSTQPHQQTQPDNNFEGKLQT